MLKDDDNATLTRVGPGTPMGELFRRFWLPACLSEELPAPDATQIRVRLLGEDLLAFRDSTGEVGLVDEACPHRTASLFFGRNEECGLRCTYHGWKFDRHGNCLDMPNEPAESGFKDKVTLKAYPTREQGGVVWAYMGPPDDVPELPKLEWSVLPEANRYVTKTEIACNYLQGMEGDIDSSHTVFLHGKVGDEAIAEGSATEFRSEILRRFSFMDRAPKFFLVDTDFGFMAGARRYGGRDHHYWRVTQWLFPAYSVIPKEPGSLMRINMRVPIDDEHHWHLRVQYRADGPLTERELYDFRYGGDIFQASVPGTYRPTQTLENDFLIDRSLQRSGTFSGIKGIPAQDQSVTVSMGPIADRTKEHLASADAAIIHARRLLLRQARLLLKEGRLTIPRGGDPYFVRGVATLLERDEAMDVGVAEAMDARNPWRPDVEWAQNDPVLDDD